MRSGNPRCEECGGTGRIQGYKGSVRCSCTRPTREVAAMQRHANARDGEPYRNRVAERIAALDAELAGRPETGGGAA